MLYYKLKTHLFYTTMKSTHPSLHFRNITHADMPLIWKFLCREHGRTTDFSYGGLFMWVDFFDYQFAIYEDTLFIKGLVENDRSKPAFSLPIGSLSIRDAISVLRDYCHEEGMPVVLSAVPEYALPLLEELQPAYIELLADWSDYLYDAEMLASLHGKKMMKKRNHVNYFTAHNPEWRFLPFQPHHVGEVLEFMNLYDSELDEAYMGKVESRLARELVLHMAENDSVLKGGILYDRPEHICAFSIGDVKDDTLFVHIEKASRHVGGSYEMINKAFAEYMLTIFPEIKYINREDDGGDEGLRHAKESYHPLALLRKYNVIL